MSRGHISELLIGFLFLLLTIIFLVSTLSSTELTVSAIMLSIGACFVLDFFWIRKPNDRKSKQKEEE